MKIRKKRGLFSTIGTWYFRAVFQFVILTCVLFLPPPVIAQDKNRSDSSQKSQYILPRIRGPVKLDGLSDEPSWKGIEPLPVVMQMPEFGNKPSERTEILVAFDNEFLYVAGRLYEKDSSKIQAPSKKRDSMVPSNDWFGIVIDSFNDKENGLGFFTTPTGLRMDAAVFNDAQGEFPLNLSWNTFWDVATKVNTQGWFVEMRIPFSSLRFQDIKGRVIMGLISWRWIARKNEIVIFPAISQEWGMWSSWKPSNAQEVVLEGVHSSKPLYVAPYLLSGFGQTYELDDPETSYRRVDTPEFEIGLDVKYGLTSNLTLDVSVNTDFAQVEADDQQINLTRFSLFFPEKRLFFQERSSNFDFNLGGPNRLFYSRRIGIHDNKQVRIYGGLRLVGRVKQWDIGFLSMQTASLEDLPSENFSVLRMRRRVFNSYSYVGGIITTRIGVDGKYNTAYGVDGIFRLFRNDYLTLAWAQTFESGKENSPISLSPARIRINWERRTVKGLGYNLSFSCSGPDYDPGMGFEIRDDYTRFGNRVLYGWLPGEDSSLFSHQVFLNGFVFFRNKDRLVESAEFGPGWEFITKSGYYGRISPKLFYENVPESFDLSDETEVPAGRYTFYGLSGEFSTPWGRLLNSQVGFDIGSFYDGSRISFTVVPRWNISSSLELSGTYQLNRIEFPARSQTFIGQIARLRVLTMLSTKFSASAFIQYNSVVSAVIANIRIRYNPREGNDLYLVYNEGLNTNRRREIPFLPFSSSRTVMLKYTYTFNF